MKQFRITVNGQVYEVAVEEVGTNTSPAANKVNTPVEKAVSKPTVIPMSKQPQPNLGGEQVTAPMPGVILQIVVQVGQKVEEGEVLLILEAMKMENEIMAPAAGCIKEIAVSKDTTVNTGDLLVVIE